MFHGNESRRSDFTDREGTAWYDRVSSESRKDHFIKEIALSGQKTEPDMHMIILLIDERPEEVTDIREAIEGPNVEVIYSTFDELPEHHKRVSEMVVARAKRLVEHGKECYDSVRQYYPTVQSL